MSSLSTSKLGSKKIKDKINEFDNFINQLIIQSQYVKFHFGHMLIFKEGQPLLSLPGVFTVES